MKKKAAAPFSKIIAIASVAVLLAALYLGRGILIPIALSVFLTLLLTPLVNRLQPYIGRVAASLVSVALAIGIMGLAGYLVSKKVMDLAGNVTLYKTRIRERIQSFSYSSATMKETLQAVKDIKKDLNEKPGETPILVQNVEADPVTTLGSIVGPLLDPLETGIIVVIFATFMLIQRDDLRDRMLRLAGEEDIHVSSQAFDEVSLRTSHFLAIQSAINAMYGLVLAIGLYFLGSPDYIAWGLLAAVLRFIPFVGIWIAAVPPIVISLALTQGWQPVYILAWYLVLEASFPTFVEPLILGAGIGISPLSLLVAAVFWTWIWGPVGLLLSTPLTASLSVLGKYVPHLRVLYIILTNDPVLDPRIRYYQRLVALDAKGAGDFARQELKDHSFSVMGDSLLLPALAAAGRDSHRGVLTAEQYALILASISEFSIAPPPDAEKVADSGAPSHQAPADSVVKLPEGIILSVPANDETDQAAAELLSSALREKGLPAKALSKEALAGEVMEAIEKLDARIVCISALPPFALRHARYLCKRIRARHPKVIVLIAVWTDKRSKEWLRRRVSCAKNGAVATSLADALQTIDRFIPQLVFENNNARRIESGKSA